MISRSELSGKPGQAQVVQESASKLDARGRRTVNGLIGLRVPSKVIRAKCALYMRDGKPIHRGERHHDAPFSSGGGGTTSGGATGAQLTATAVGTTQDANATPVAADQVRVVPGIYDGPIPPSAAELNPSVNAVYGGIAKMVYLDPPRMDIARTLSCTIYTTLAHTSNKLTRPKLGPLADPFRVEVEPDLAESWEISEDGAKHTFKLRQGAKFHNKAPVNGREFTAQDVIKTVEMYSAGSQADVFAPVESMETPDDYTIVFNLNQPLNDFPLSLAAWSYIYPTELVDDEEMRQGVAIGTGPFTQEEWTQKERSVFARNPDYWEMDAAGNQLPYLDGVEVYVQSDLNAHKAGLITHNYGHFSSATDDEAAQLAQDGETLVIGRNPVSRGANVNGFQFQMTNPTYQDERVRRAWALAFNADEFDLARGGDNTTRRARTPTPRCHGRCCSMPIQRAPRMARGISSTPPRRPR